VQVGEETKQQTAIMATMNTKQHPFNNNNNKQTTNNIRFNLPSTNPHPFSATTTPIVIPMIGAPQSIVPYVYYSNHSQVYLAIAK
jgi:hypothetical protein